MLNTSLNAMTTTRRERLLDQIDELYKLISFLEEDRTNMHKTISQLYILVDQLQERAGEAPEDEEALIDDMKESALDQSKERDLFED